MGTAGTPEHARQTLTPSHGGFPDPSLRAQPTGNPASMEKSATIPKQPLHAAPTSFSRKKTVGQQTQSLPAGSEAIASRFLATASRMPDRANRANTQKPVPRNHPFALRLYSETISSYSNYFVIFRNNFRLIQKQFSSYSETLFVVFRNSFRRIQ